MNRFQEVNDLHDGTLNEVHCLTYSTEISSNECFMFCNAMKQEDKLSVIFQRYVEVYQLPQRIRSLVNSSSRHSSKQGTAY